MNEQDLEQLAERSAKVAVKKTFAILGVDVDKPESLEDFRRDLRFAGDLRVYANRGILAFIAVVAGGVVAALWTGITKKIGS